MTKIFRIVEICEPTGCDPLGSVSPLSPWRTSRLWCEEEVERLRAENKHTIYDIEESDFIS